MKMYNQNMGMGMDIVHVVLEFLLNSNVHHPVKQFKNPLLLLHYLGHHIWVGYTWKVAAVGKQLVSAMVLYWKVMGCHLWGCPHLQRS